MSGEQIYPPAELRRRAFARLTDTVLALLPFVALDVRNRPVVSALCAVALSLCNDRLFGPGRSLGKRLFGLRCVMLESRTPSGIIASMKRNAAIGLALFPAAGGDRRGPLLAAIALLVVIISETVAVLAPLQRIQNLGRRRIGDVAAGTQVIDASIPLLLAVPLLPAVPAAALGSPQRVARAQARPLEARPGPGARDAPLGRPEGTACASP